MASPVVVSVVVVSGSQEQQNPGYASVPVPNLASVLTSCREQEAAAPLMAMHQKSLKDLHAVAAGSVMAVHQKTSGPLKEFHATAAITLPPPKPIKIDMEDIIDEIHFCESVVVCFVIGANPPLHVIDG